jgi:hypothetical protein
MLECSTLGGTKPAPTYSGRGQSRTWTRREPARRLRPDRDFHNPMAGHRPIWSHMEQEGRPVVMTAARPSLAGPLVPRPGPPRSCPPSRGRPPESPARTARTRARSSG